MRCPARGMLWQGLFMACVRDERHPNTHRSVLGWEEWGIDNASAILCSSLKYLNRTSAFSIPSRADPLGIYPLFSVFFFTREQKTWYLMSCLEFRKSVPFWMLHFTDDLSIIFFPFSFVFPTESTIGRDHILQGMTAGLLHCHTDIVSDLGLFGYNNWVSLFLFVFPVGRLWNPWCRHLAGCYPRELCHPLLFLPIPVSCQPTDRHRDICHDHWLRGLHRCHQRKQVPPAECEYWAAAAVFAVLWCCAIAMHAAVTCISTEVTHLAQMSRESCVKQAVIITPRSCQVIPGHALRGGWDLQEENC